MATTMDEKRTNSQEGFDEKSGAQHVDGSVNNSTEDPDDFGFSDKQQRKIISHIDRRLTVTVGIMYCVSLMDRTNMSAANIAGMSEELNLSINLRYVSVHHPHYEIERGENPYAEE